MSNGFFDLEAREFTVPPPDAELAVEFVVPAMRRILPDRTAFGCGGKIAACIPPAF
jgi:hypothetical protein